MKLEKIKLSVAAAAMGLALTGCASTMDAPVALMSEAEADVKAAEEIGAEEHAPVALRSARNHLSEARNLMGDEDMDEADYTKAKYALEQALADAEYATAKSHAAKSQNAAEQLEENLDALRQAL